jgi:hypothetical protein
MNQLTPEQAKRINRPIQHRKRTKPDSCELNFKDKPRCEFTLGLQDETYGFCKKCKRDYVLENAKFGETRYDIIEGTWVVKKYDMFKAWESYGGVKPFSMPDVKWANGVLEDSDMWQEDVIEFAKNILKEEESSDSSK